MKKFIISAFAVAAMLLGSPVASAQTHAAQTDGTSAEMPWFVSMGYGGFDFEIPAGSIVEKGSTVGEISRRNLRTFDGKRGDSGG